MKIKTFKIIGHAWQSIQKKGTYLALALGKAFFINGKLTLTLSDRRFSLVEKLLSQSVDLGSISAARFIRLYIPDIIRVTGNRAGQ